MLKSPLKTLIRFSVPLLSLVFSFTVEDFLEARQSYEQVDRSYHAARDILDNLTRRFGVQFSNTDTLIWNLHNTALLGAKRNQLRIDHFTKQGLYAWKN